MAVKGEIPVEDLTGHMYPQGKPTPAQAEEEEKKKEAKKKGLLSTIFGFGDEEEEEESESASTATSSGETGTGTGSDKDKVPPKGILESAYDWVGDKATEMKHNYDLKSGNKADFERFKGHKDAQMSLIDQRILYDEWARQRDAGTLDTFDPKSLTPEERLKIRKSLKDETKDAYLDEEFQKSIVQPYNVDREKSMAEKDRLAKADAWDQQTADAIRNVTAPRPDRKTLTTSNFKGNINTGAGDLQGILSKRGNLLATQNLKLTA